MKKLKQFGSLVLALMLAVALSCPAFAAGDAYTITINGDAENHTYQAYQIFTGDLSNNKLSNIEWGSGIDQGKAAAKFSGKSAAKVAEDLSKAENDSETAKQYAKNFSECLSTTCTESTAEGKTYTIGNLSAGYYLVKDKDKSLSSEANDFYTGYIMKVVENVTATPKGDKPSVEKKVKDINDSEDTEQSNWQDSADHDIGDVIPFQLTGTVASNYDAYKTYKFIFHDVESAGLTFDENSVQAFVGETAIDASDYSVVTDTDDGCTFHVVFNDLKSISAVQAGSKINVRYNATLNEQAVIGSAGNPNKVSLEYSNNPNDSQGGENTGKTPEDTVIVFTYKTVINKVDQDNKPLTGAEFKLEKYIKATGTWKEITVVKNDVGTVFTFNGLDDGQYRLSETATPEGYNTIQDITFKITASHDILSDSPALTELNGNKVNGEITFTSATNDGSLTANIVNRSGSTLPTTGGMGTTVLYVVGGALVVCAGVALVAKKRMQ